jgi:NAD(P)-dependent dehydrogenase (short-subunit alcohol dehydrogenase family)
MAPTRYGARLHGPHPASGPMHYRQPDERIMDRNGMTPSSESAAPGELFAVAGKTVVVTGGTRGIGAMVAGGFVDAGADVIVASRKAEAVEAAVNELSDRGACIGFAVDLSSEEGARRLAEAIGAVRSQVDVLVNNAGATWGAPIEEHDSASWDRVLDLNVQGVFHTTKFLLPLLGARATADQPSRVINIGSIDGIHVPALETYSYGASKAAVHHLTRHLARRLAPTITVNAVAPGPFPSKMMAATLDAFGDQIAAAAPLKRIGRPDDMAGVTIFLASRAASYITGAVIPVDGGIATTA